VGIEQKLKTLLSGLSPWAPLFAFVSLFQFMRGAYFDAIYFALAVLVLLIDGKKIFPYEFPKKPLPNSAALLAGAVIVGTAVLLVPRKSALEVALMISVLFIALGLVWYKDSGPLGQKTKANIRSKWMWIVIAIATSIWELISYVRSDIVGDAYAYPTVSILMAPVMADEIGRASFLFLWLIAGFLLFRVVGRK
jgi:hypothetical protein